MKQLDVIDFKNFEARFYSKGKNTYLTFFRGGGEAGGVLLKANLSKCALHSTADDEVIIFVAGKRYEFSFFEGLPGFYCFKYKLKLWGWLPLSWGSGQVTENGKDKFKGCLTSIANQSNQRVRVT